MTKSFKELAGLNVTESKEEVSPEEAEKIESRQQYEKIYLDITEDINSMKRYAKEKGLTNEEISPLSEALQAIDRVDDLIRANFSAEDEPSEEDIENDGKW